MVWRSRGVANRSPFLVWPTEFHSVTQVFGANPASYIPFGLPGHEGLDIKATADSKIFAVLAGKVTYVQHDPTKSNYGKHLWIDHLDGRNTHYAHLNRIDVSAGQMVTAGQVLGLAGSTGNSSGPHLHLDLTHPGKTYTDEKGQVWPFNRFNPWWELLHLYKPDGRTVLEGWVYDPYLTKGSDGQAVNYSTNLSLRSGPGSNHPKIGTVPYGTMFELAGDAENSYRPVLTWAVAESTPTPPTGNAQLGLHASADPGDLSTAEIQEFKAAKPGVIKVLSAHSGPSIATLANQHPGVPFIIRAFLDFGGRVITPQQFFNDTIGDTKRAVDAIGSGREIWVELHNEPNLTSEGLGASWADGAGFNSWLLAVLALYKAALPAVKYMYPGLSPQFTGYRPFLNASLQAAMACDGVAVHCYWSNDYSMNQALADTVDYYVQVFGNDPLWITEASQNKSGVTASQKGVQYITFWNELKNRPSVKGVCYFVASASNPAFGWGTGGSCETWLGQGIAGIVGSR